MTANIFDRHSPLLLDRCRVVTTRFSNPKGDIDQWEKRLISLLYGLHNGRLDFGMGTDECYSIDALEVGRPDDLAAPLLLSMAVVANSPEIWREFPDWRIVEAVAQALASEIADELTPETRGALDDGMSARLTHYLTAVRGRSLPRTNEVQIDV